MPYEVDPSSFAPAATDVEYARDTEPTDSLITAPALPRRLISVARCAARYARARSAFASDGQLSSEISSSLTCSRRAVWVARATVLSSGAMSVTFVQLIAMGKPSKNERRRRGAVQGAAYAG